MQKPYSRLFLTTIVAATLLASSAASVDWPVDGGDGQRRWYKPTYYDTSGNENASTYNLGCTINRFYVYDNTIYAECNNTIHKIQLTYPNLTYQGNFSLGAGEDMKGIPQGKVITSAGKAYDTNGSLLWTAGNITYNKWNGTQYVPTIYVHIPTATKAVTENHVYTVDHYPDQAIMRAYDLSGNGIGLFRCGIPGFTAGQQWFSIADDGNYMVAKCQQIYIYGSQNWNTIVTYNLDYTLYDHRVTCSNTGPLAAWGPLLWAASNQSLISCTPSCQTTPYSDASLMLGSNQKIQFYGLWNTVYYATSNEPDARNYLNYSETVDNTTNYGNYACYDEANWYETSGTNLTKWTVPRTNPVWSVIVNPSGKPICLENVILLTNASGTILAKDKQTGTIQNSINMFTANQILIGGANTIITTSGTKIHHTSPRTTTILKPDLTIQKITWEKT